MSGAAPERRFCSQISWPARSGCSCPWGPLPAATSNVLLTAESDETQCLSKVLSVLGRRRRGGRRAEEHREHRGGQAAAGRQHRHRLRASTILQSEVRDVCLGHDARRGHLRGGSHRARNRQARAQRCDAVHTAVDRKKVVSDPRTGPLQGPTRRRW